MDETAKNNIIEQYAEEFLNRRKAGESPTIEEFTARNPEWSAEIKDFIETFLMLHEFAGQPDDPKTMPAPAEKMASMMSIPDIDGYEITKELGRGGMGVVYDAKHISLDRDVALKVLPGRWTNNATSKERFLREAKSAAGLHHTNIVPVFDVGNSGSVYYYAMQRIQGAPLNDVIYQVDQIQNGSASDTEAAPSSDAASAAIARHVLSGLSPESAKRPLPNADVTVATKSEPTGRVEEDPLDTVQKPKSDMVRNHSSHVSRGVANDSTVSGSRRKSYYIGVARIGHQVADALSYAHSRGVVHRDIKPANLLLDHAGNTWITDFGLAKTEDEGLTETGGVVGTVRYMSPERFKGQHEATCDVYALGMTLYEMLAFQSAFDSTDQLELIHQIQAREPVSLRKIDRSIPRDLETIVHTAIEKSPAHRYSSARHLEEDLQRFLNDSPISARKTGWFEQLGRWANKNRAIATMLAIILIGLTAGIIATTFGTIAYRDIALEASQKSVEATKKTIEAETKAKEAQSINDFLNSDILEAANLMEGNVNRELPMSFVLEQAGKKIPKRFANEPVIAGQLHRTIGEAFTSLGNHELAAEHLNRSYELLKQELGANDLDTLKTLMQIGRFIIASRGNAKTAKDNLEKVRELRVERLGVDDPETLIASYELARFYMLINNYWDQGLKMMGEVHEKSLANESYRLSVKALVALSKFHLREKQFVLARPMIEESLKLSEQHLGDEDILTLMSRMNKAELALTEYKIEPAAKLFEQNLKVSEAWLGKEHPQTLRVLERIPSVYGRQGRKEDCLETHRELIKRFTQTYGAGHERVLDQQISYARRLIKFDGLEQQAVEILREARDGFKALYGAQNRTIGKVDAELAIVFVEQGKLESAKRHIEKAKKTLEANHNNILRAEVAYFKEAGQFNRVREILLKDLDVRRKRFGNGGMEEIKLNQNIVFYDLQIASKAIENDEQERAQNQLKMAEERMQKGMTMLDAFGHQGQVQAEERNDFRMKLAVCLMMQERLEKALETIELVIEFDDWTTTKKWMHFRALAIRGDILTKLGKLDLAEASLLEAQNGFDPRNTRRTYRVSQEKQMAKLFVQLYEEMERDEDVKIWQQKLEAIEKEETARSAQ